MARRKVGLQHQCLLGLLRRRVWRQLAISIQAVIALRTLTSQNRPLPMTPSEVR